MAWLSLILQCLRSRPRSVGERGERAAELYLLKQGYRLLQRNRRTRLGEIDLLMLAPDRKTLVIIEVKARELTDKAQDPLRPEVHVDRAKQRKLTALAHQLVKQKRFADCAVRFDVVGVDLPPQGQPIIRHHPGAFEALWG